MKSTFNALLSSLIILLPASTFAGAFYVGAGVGPDMGTVNVNSHVWQVSGGILSFDVKNKTQAGAIGAFGSLYVGYGAKFTEFGLPWNGGYLGAEINGNLSSLAHESSNKEFVHASFSKTYYRVQNSVGVSLMPGYIYQDQTLFYSRFGYANGNFKVSTTDASLASINKRLNGVRFGLGVQQHVTCALAVRVECNHISYNKASVSTLDALSNTSKSTSLTPNTNEVEFGLIYTL